MRGGGRGGRGGGALFGRHLAVGELDGEEGLEVYSWREDGELLLVLDVELEARC